jgi:hypothetical protein
VSGHRQIAILTFPDVKTYDKLELSFGATTHTESVDIPAAKAFAYGPGPASIVGILLRTGYGATVQIDTAGSSPRLDKAVLLQLGTNAAAARS